jgi:3-isopropylmalate/(R)-2-methylmalate dehydratase small subunit
MPEPITILEGKAAPILSDDVDTDQIIPAEFLKVIQKAGLGKYLFYRWRYNDQGQLTGEFVLDKPEFRGTKFLVAAGKFGTGSSRENAVWALLDAGIRCVISASFGDIFYNNAAKNGLLCVRLGKQELNALLDSAASGELQLKADLPNQTLYASKTTVKFQIEPHIKERLINGLDEIGLTLTEYERLIVDYEKRAPVYLTPVAAEAQ